MDEAVVSDESAPGNVDLSNICFADVRGRAGVGTVIGGTSAHLGGGERVLSGQRSLLCAFLGKGLWWPLRTCEMQPCLGAGEAGAREPCAQHVAFARPGNWGSVF